MYRLLKATLSQPDRALTFSHEITDLVQTRQKRWFRSLFHPKTQTNFLAKKHDSYSIIALKTAPTCQAVCPLPDKQTAERKAQDMTFFISP